MERSKDKNPKSREGGGWTPLHLTFGQVNVCSTIMDMLQDKSSRDNAGQTPLHLAAKEGQVVVCRIILEIVKINHPVNINNEGQTPFNINYSGRRAW
jgi:ankyrin repeat protein